MNIKKFFTIFIGIFTLSLFAMEPEKPKKGKEEVKKTIVIPKDLKRINGGFHVGTIVPQGKLIKNDVFLDLNAKEVFTQYTFKELIKEAQDKDMPFILAIGITAGGKNNVRTVHFYSGTELANYLASFPFDETQRFYLDPSTKNPFFEGIKFYAIDSLKDKFEYLFSDYDFSYGDKKVNDFVRLYFDVVAEPTPYVIFALGEFYENGIGVTKDLKKAIKWYERAGKLKNSEAYYKIGMLYKRGEGVEQSTSKAIEFFKKAKSLGNEKALEELIALYKKGNEEALDLNVQHLETQAQQGNSLAQLQLGLIYEEGIGVDKDLEKAINFYNLATYYGKTEVLLSKIKEGTIKEASNRLALYAQADALEKVEKYSEAKEKYKQSASMGYSEAFEALARLESDPITKIKLYAEAANKGSVEAQLDLALIYQNGSYDQPIDRDKALYWYKNAVQKGSSFAIESVKLLEQSKKIENK